MHFPYGTISTELPKDFFPPEMWPEYAAITDPPPICKREIISKDPPGTRWGLWPLYFEMYVGDTEPDIAASSAGSLTYNRIATWRRLTRSDIPRGWRRGTRSIFRIDGFQVLPESGDCTERWNKNARREARLWRENHYNKTHTIEEIVFAEYSVAYKKSLIAQREGLDRLHNLEHKLAVPVFREHCVLWGVRNISTGNIVAGTAVIFSPTYASSTHFAPFILEEARQVFAATGLIHRWFEESKQKNMPHVMTTNFWHPGKPKSWKGFSEFKSHFGFEYVTYPPVLWRLVRGKFF